jgi:ABC-type branched-subunit amino acid transport system substrate-binding protein
VNLRTGRWAKLLALLFSMTLLAAACGGNADDGDDEASGASEPAGDGGDGGGEVEAGPGFDGTTITLGVVTPQTGVAAVIGNPLTAGNRTYWDRVNEEGGIAGKYKVELEVVDSQYQPQTGVQQYNAIKNDVVAFQQILGTNVLNAILPQLKRDNIVASPATLDSFWIAEEQLLALGAPYQIQAINGMDWYVNQEGNEDPTVCIMRQNDPYGEAGLEGLEFAAEEMGFEIAEDVTFAPTDTDFGAPVNRLKGAGCTVVLLVGLPNSTGGVMGTAEQIAFTPQWLGVSPTWLGLLAGNAYMQQNFKLIAEGPEAGDTESEGMAQLEADMAKYAPDQKPDLYFTFGYAQAWSMAQVLEKAVEDGDLSREGIKAAMESVGTITTGGLLGDYEYGPPEDRKFPRASRIFSVDAAAPGGLKAVAEEFTSDAAEAFELE